MQTQTRSNRAIHDSHNNGFTAPHEELLQETLRFAHDIKAPAMVLKHMAKETLPHELLQQSIDQLLALSQNYIQRVRREILSKQINSHSTANTNIHPVPRLPQSHIESICKEAIALIAHNHKDTHPVPNFYNYLTLQSDDCDGQAGTRALPTSPAHPTLLRSIIENLLTNAYQATSTIRQPSIRVSLYQKRNKLIIEIQDNGCGMNRTQIQSILSPKPTTPFAPSSKKTGNGIALRSALHLLRSWGGHLRLKSEVGKGCVALVELSCG